MPVCVFVVGVAFGTEKYVNVTMINMVVVTVGVMIASYGEINFHPLGVALQVAVSASPTCPPALDKLRLRGRGAECNCGGCSCRRLPRSLRGSRWCRFCCSARASK
jgi:hypothetical protein